MEAQLRVDTLSIRNLRDFARKFLDTQENLGDDISTYILLFLFEELKLDARIDKAYDVLKVFGVPEQINVKQQAQSIKSQVNIKDLLENFLPGAYDFLLTMRNNASAVVEMGVYSPTIALAINLKLEGLGHYADLVL